jgi:hypothetical protein
MAVTITVGSAGCSTFVGAESDPVDLYIINDTDSEVSVQLRYLSCDQVGDKMVEIGELNPGYYHFSANEIVSNSGLCSLKITTGRGLSDEYEWQVGEKTLVIRIEPDSIQFAHRPPGYDP